MHGAEKLPAPMLRRLRRSMIAVRCFSLPAGGPMPAFAPLRTERRTNDFCATTAPSLAGSRGSQVTQRQRLPEALRAVAGANTCSPPDCGLVANIFDSRLSERVLAKTKPTCHRGILHEAS